MDGLKDMVKLDRDAPELRDRVRELKERAVLFLEAMLREGGYFAAVEEAYFVDSGEYPETNDDGIARQGDGGVAVNTIVERAADYLAPVCHHFGDNHLPEGYGDGADAQGLRPHRRLHAVRRREGAVHRRARPRGQRERAAGPDGRAARQGPHQARGAVGRRRHRRRHLFLPASERVAEFAALEFAKAMNLQDPEVINKQVMHPSEGTLVEVKGRLDVAVDPANLVIPPKPEVLSDEEIKAFVTEKKLKVVCATVGNDEHSVGMREIIDIKHGGLEKWGVGCEYLGTSVPVEKVLDAAIEHAAQCVLISTIITHGEIHRQNMEKLADLAVEKGVRDKLLLISGGTQVTDELARSWGMDAGFGRGTKGINVASFIVNTMRERGM